MSSITSEPKKWRQVALLRAEGARARSDSDAYPDSSGDWANLSDEEAKERQELFRQLRAKQEFKTTRLGTLYEARKWIAVIVLAFVAARRAGRVRETGAGLLLALAYSQRAPRLLNANPAGSLSHLPWFGCALNLTEALKSLAAYSLVAAKRADFASFNLAFPGGQRAVALMDVRDRTYVLRDNWQSFTKNLPGSAGGFDEMLFELLGRGIFTVDGAEWRDARKVASAMFSFGSLREQMQVVFSSHGEQLADALEHMTDRPFDLQDVFQSLTFDAICELAFGETPDALSESLRGHKPAFLVSFDILQATLAMRGIQPPFFWKLKRFFNVLDEGRARQHVAVCKAYVKDIIDRRRASKDVDARKDLLSLYLAHAAKSGLAYMASDAYLMDVIFNFMLAGRDTTSCTLTNWIKLVYSAPQSDALRERLLREQREQLQGRDMQWDDVQNLCFASAVFNETIRMYPPVPVDFRMANQSEVLPSGLRVERGDRVGFPIFAMAHDPHLWPQPDAFLPDRWIKQDAATALPARVRRPEEYVLPVFWGGARLCLGKDMARFEVIMIASILMKRFKFRVRPHEELFVNGPVMFLKGGLWVEVDKA
jgi:cytochrome P450